MATPAKGDRRQRFRKDAEQPKPEPKKAAKKTTTRKK